jgi:hypothetical protein
MSRTEDLEREERERRWAQTSKLHDWAVELKALGKMLWDADSENGWHVPPIKREPQLMVLVMMDGAEFARFTRDEMGIVGVFSDGKPHRFANRHEAFDAAVKRRMDRAKF